MFSRTAYYYSSRPIYHTYTHKQTAKRFRSLQITTSALFVYFFMKAYVVGIRLNCIDLSMKLEWVVTTYAFTKKIRHHETRIYYFPHPLNPTFI